jgi:branched-chain amino acid transport system substrate-binding protein
VRAAGAANAPGVTDTEIKIGQTMPYSGPLSPYGVIGRAEGAYFRMINDQGGLNGRKLNLISLDDGFSPPKTVEQTRRLVEEEQVAFIYGSIGDITALAVRQYLNDKRVPQLFIGSPADLIDDPRQYPWTLGGGVASSSEAHVYAKHIVASKPNAKIGVLYNNNNFGKNVIKAIGDWLGPDRASMLVSEVSFQEGEPTVDSQMITLQASGADTLIIVAAPRVASLAIRKGFDMGWAADRFLFSAASSVAATLKPAGLDKSKGIISGGSCKDPTDPRWKDDPGVREWADFAAKYLTDADVKDINPFRASFLTAMMMTQVLRQCGDNLSRDNIMRQALNLKNFTTPALLPGITVNTSPTNYWPIRQFQLERFNGENWELFGDVLTD